MIGRLDLAEVLRHATGGGGRRLRAQVLRVTSMASLVGIVVIGGYLASVIAGPRAPDFLGATSTDRPDAQVEDPSYVTAQRRREHPSPALSHAELLSHVRRATSRPGTVVRELVVVADATTGRRTVLLRVDLEGIGSEAVSAALGVLQHPALTGLSVTTITPVPTGGRIELAASIAVDPSRDAGSETRPGIPLATTLTGLVTESGARLTTLELAAVRRDDAVLLVVEGAVPALVRLLEELESGPTAAPRVRTLHVGWETQGAAEMRLTFTTREGAEDA